MTTTIKPSPACARLEKALKYLQQHDVDITSRTDVHYLEALRIASGIKPKKQ